MILAEHLSLALEDALFTGLETVPEYYTNSNQHTGTSATWKFVSIFIDMGQGFAHCESKGMLGQAQLPFNNEIGCLPSFLTLANKLEANYCCLAGNENLLFPTRDSKCLPERNSNKSCNCSS